MSIGGLLVAATAALALGRAELGFSTSVTPGLVAEYRARFGTGVPQRLDGWKGFVEATSARPTGTRGEEDLLAPVNRYFNRVRADTDLALWHAEDYWATPAEMLSINGADCEDFAIAKYFTLKELGVPVSRLRLVYARAGHSRDAHLVLAYYPSPRADPLILDNLQNAIAPASERPDLTPVFTFNDEDLLVLPSGGRGAVRTNAASNRKWRELLDKLEREQRA